MLDDDLKELSSAEDFLEYFGLTYDQRVVQVNRLHILQRFHDYLGQAVMPKDDAGRRRVHADLLGRAYGDFLESDARTEKVFAVFRQVKSPPAFFPAEDLLK